MQTVPRPVEGPTVTLNVVVAGSVKFRLKVVKALVATKVPLDPFTLTPRDVPVFFFIEKDSTAGVLRKNVPLVTDSVRPWCVWVKTRF